MARNLSFTNSIDGVKRATTTIQYRIGVEQVAWACAEVARDKECNPRLVSKSEMEKHLRTELWDKGFNAFLWEQDPDVEELFAEALDHVRGIYAL